MRCRLGVAIAFLLAAPLLFGGTMRGTVHAGLIRVAQARVSLEMRGVGVAEVLTDSNGSFEFQNVPLADCEIVVRKEGYATVRQRTEIVGKEIPMVTIALEPEARRKTKQATISVGELKNGDAGRLLSKAARLMKDGKYSAAAEVMKHAVEQDPANGQFREALGVALMQDNQNDAAIAELKRADERNAPRASLYLAMIYNNLRRDREAEAAARAAVEKNRADWKAWRELGQAQFHLNRLGEARHSLQRALDAGGAARVHLDMANVYVTSSDYRRAAEQFRQFLLADPDAPQAARVRRVLAEMDQAGVLRQ